ncbi:MAG TPA: hypothetical protein VGS22_03670 [Thermoanaerobaculia bacterium]|nr:hypothetical protein [Thermoanaerobaculia bacterium]
MLLHDARSEAREAPDGLPILLEAQDRTRWGSPKDRRRAPAGRNKRSGRRLPKSLLPQAPRQNRTATRALFAGLRSGCQLADVLDANAARRVGVPRLTLLLI